MGDGSSSWYGKKSFASNGERIYYTGISARTGPIRVSGGPMWMAHGGVGCVACHGVHGRGGIPVMMGTAIPEDIRYEALTKGDHEKEKGEMEHPPYTDALIKRAVTQGVDPAGRPLDWTMPRWYMGDADLDDLLAYLRTLR
jgi:mono/diheme cytochrome c family protein